MTLSLDGSVNSNSIAGSVVTAVLSTSLPNDILLAFIKSSSNNAITGITSTSGLTWNFRAAAILGTTRIELWWAYAPGALTSESISATYTSPPVSGRMIAVAVNGADLSTPFDVNAALPATAAPGSVVGDISVNISTTNNDTIAFSWFNPASGNSGLVKPSGFTNIFEATNFYSLDYRIYSSAQSGTNILYDWSFNQDATLIVDALQQAAAAGSQAAPLSGSFERLLGGKL